ncbi:MAG: hypothetical protein Q8L48_33280 [Archangium sp.]|nr:hypothetical protein [Archangium sp.]
MGGALKSIGGAIGGVIKQVAPSILKAVAPAATGLLKKLTDGFVNTGANFLKTALGALPLPSPLKALGEKLLGKGAEMLKQFAGGGIDKLIQGLGDLVMKRLAPGAGQVALPGMNTAPRQDGIANNPPPAPGTGSSSAPATGSSSAPATGSSSGASGASGGANLPPKPLSGEDAKDVSKQNAYNEQMFNYQQAMSNMNKFWEMMSTVQKSHDQTRSSMIQNLR